MLFLTILLGLVALGASAAAVALYLQTSRLKQQHLDANKHIQALQSSQVQNESMRSQNAQLSQMVEEARDEDRKKVEWLDHQQQEIDWLRAELEKRPKITQKRYKILTVGVKWTGKTSLTLKWSNPLVDLGALQGTKIERYERTVSHVTTKEVVTEHVFEIGDWGGEHIVDAQQELIMDEIHGLLMVVDLAGKEGQRVDQQRVHDQLREFQPQSLKYFFGPKTLASCKAVVLFINKSDVLSGTPAEVEREAKNYYKPLIDALELYKSQIDIRVLVGSATYGHSTHFLFSHFVERILPKNAYDTQLLQRMKADLPHSAQAIPHGLPPAHGMQQPGQHGMHPHQVPPPPAGAATRLPQPAYPQATSRFNGR
ncbi:hypothetical protein [Chondromyces crocatus]|uniref:G domain-containing protein n=1 Tax=Chondromyces crocatus TaxID=52 RepID=A0A0K1ENG2_CHOCO|nr:hypothetical protein [Chondromyces crocatus]AKT42386.1 uncharacterized protein CMC5_066120 [Chondromyces crocatus]